MLALILPNHPQPTQYASVGWYVTVFETAACMFACVCVCVFVCMCGGVKWHNNTAFAVHLHLSDPTTSPWVLITR